jgi:hypothetical protein
MNNFGKERFAKQVASQIEMLNELSNKSKPVIPLEWKEVLTTLHNNPSNNHENNIMTTVNVTAETLIPSTLTQTITNNTLSESQPRISTRNKKVSSTMTSDFLW